MRGIKFRKLFSFLVLGIFIIIALPMPALAHGGMVGFFEGIISIGLLALAPVFLILSIVVTSAGGKDVVLIFNGIFCLFSIILTIHCANVGFTLGLPLIAAIWYGSNMLWSGLLTEASNKLEKDVKKNRVVFKQEPKMLLAADANARDEKGKTPLIMAAFNGYVDTVGIMIDNGADINARDDENKTALMWAAYNGYDDVVQLLLVKGADAAAVDNNGNTALNYAEKRVHHEVAKILKSTIINK